MIWLKAGDATFRMFALRFGSLFFINYYYPFIRPLTSEGAGSMFGYLAAIMMICQQFLFAYYKSRM